MTPIEITEEQLTSVLHSVAPFTITLTPPGITLYQIVSSLSKGAPLHILETGCVRDPTPTGMMTDGWSTFYFSKWVNENPGSKLTSVEINPINIEYGKLFIKRFNFSQNPEYITADSVAAIQGMAEHPDVFYLDSCDDLDHGLAEFQAALEHHPRLIIMDDLVSKAAKAVDFAKAQGIRHEFLARYTIFFPTDD